MTIVEEPTILSLDDIKAAIAVRQTEEQVVEVEEAKKKYQYVRPFTSAAEGLIDYAQNPAGRFMLGIRDIDAMTRGFGKGELTYITGRAHSGKTQLLLQAISNSPSTRVVLFTPDEVAELVLSKLVAMHYNISAEDVEARIKEGDQNTIDMVRRAAAHDFRNLIVVDDSLTLNQMGRALEEAEDWWGAKAEVVIIDFLELIPGEDNGPEGVNAKSQALKRATKHWDVPVLCLHQASRSSGPRGKAAGMGAMRYGGETEAIMVLEVYRRRDDETLDEIDRRRYANSITVSVAKNKRPPSKRGEVDLYIHPEHGTIRPLRDEDLLTFGVPVTTADDAYRIAAK